jgi:hypothetical protein
MNRYRNNSFSPAVAATPTSEEVARWMLLQIEKHRILHQAEAAAGIARTFGQAFTYANETGNTAIRREVLSEFRKLTEDLVILDRQSGFWRKRDVCDDPGPRSF